MDNSFQTSFIPKKPITSVGGRTNSGAPTSLFTVMAIIVLIVVGGASAGLYLYKNYLTKEVESLSASLKIVRDSFEEGTIEELSLYDKRIDSSRLLLSNHIVLSPMFEKLGTLTLPTIQYTNFEHSLNGDIFSVKMAGIASDYKSIALQANVFNADKGRYFKNVVFSNLVKDKNNKVKFNIEFDIDKSLMSYVENNKINANNKAIQSSSKEPAPAPAVPVSNTPQGGVGTGAPIEGTTLPGITTPKEINTQQP